MLQVTIKIGSTDSDGGEEQLTDFSCDYPGCPNIATDVLGCVKDLGLSAAVCEEHAPKRQA